MLLKDKKGKTWTFTNKNLMRLRGFEPPTLGSEADALSTELQALK